ncbi:hypothetical protein K3495_g1076 [Podosphaera aphanis]|nr:hypothetical protein K3495_g1076 [Podosphaera aphanis]
MGTQIFDELVDLEQQFYDSGFQQGLADGKVAGLREGRTFGLERGFEKYAESGRLYGRSLVWANQMVLAQNAPTSEVDQESQASAKLKPLPSGRRLSKHLKVLHALVEPETLSIQNTEESVSDFDDRLKRAQAKAKMVEKLIGEHKTKKPVNNTLENIEDFKFPDTLSIKVDPLLEKENVKDTQTESQ